MRAALSAAWPVSSSISARPASRSRVASPGGGARDQPAQGGDRRVAVALGEVEAGEGADVGGARVRAGRRRRGRELGAGGLGAFDLEQELGEGQAGAGHGRVAARGAQHRLGGVGRRRLSRCHCTSAARTPALSGKRRFIVASSAPTAASSPFSSSEREPGEVQPLVAGHRREAGVDRGERPGGVPGLQPVGDEDEVGHDVARVLGDDARRPSPPPPAGRCRGGSRRSPSTPGSGVAGVELEGAGGVDGGGVDVLDLERELGEPAWASARSRA